MQTLRLSGNPNRPVLTKLWHPHHVAEGNNERWMLEITAFAENAKKEETQQLLYLLLSRSTDILWTSRSITSLTDWDVGAHMVSNHSTSVIFHTIQLNSFQAVTQQHVTWHASTRNTRHSQFITVTAAVTVMCDKPRLSRITHGMISHPRHTSCFKWHSTCYSINIKYVSKYLRGTHHRQKHSHQTTCHNISATAV